MVAGGLTTGDTKTATTEILRTIDGRWTMARNLPHTVYGLSGATLDNTVYMLSECRSLYTDIPVMMMCSDYSRWL